MPAGRPTDPFATGHLRDGLKRRAVRGGTLVLAAQGVKTAVQIVAIAVLARLLTPSDFGLFAIVLALLTVLELFKDLGLSSATVQRAEITGRQVSTLFWLNIALGTAAAALLVLAAPLLARSYGEQRLADLVPVVAISLVIGAAAAQHLALLRRQMRFRALVAVQTGSEILSLCAALAAAWFGLGVWALVVQRVVWSALLSVGAMAASGWRPGLPGRLREVRGLVSFGVNATGAMVLGRLSSTVDKFLIGGAWGIAALGFFERAQKLTMFPVQSINTPLSAIALPMLSRLSAEPDRYRRAYEAMVRPLAMLLAPVAGLLCAAGGPVAEFVLGPQWGEAGAILSWLGLSLFYMPITYTLSWLYMSQDRTGEMLGANAVNVALTLAALFCALPFGVEAVAAAYALTGALLRAPILFRLAGRRGPVRFAQFPRLLGLPLLGLGAAAAAVWLCRIATPVDTLTPVGQVPILAVIAASAALSAYGLVPGGRAAIVDLLRLRRHLVRQEARA